MTVVAVSEDPGQRWDDLVRFWEEMEWPEGSKVEIIEGIVTVSPAPGLHHNAIAASMQRPLYAVIPRNWSIFQTQAIAVPSRRAMFIPDLLVYPDRENPESDTHLPAALAELVVEVTSAYNARHDRVTKPAAYATAGIPLYLLADRWNPDGPTLTLYGEPEGDVYRPLSTAKFGEPVALPAPFDLELDTCEFPDT
ncbi:Uma2 family endonuclease [Streptomyces hirsutus]|uniref:Uma2 family endonuclease n=1 Tax=Streptomyces TaxID=1883 RepID=UPI0033187BB7|nr:Uma2 family endonuclease [Streptomyces sp. NBC_01635]